MFLALPVRETVKGHGGQSPVPTDRLWSKDVTLEVNLTVAGVTEAHVDFPDSCTAYAALDGACLQERRPKERGPYST